MTEKNNVFLGIPIGCTSLESATRKALAAIDGRAPQLVFSCAMAHSLNVAQTDLEFAEALHDADMVVADGVGVYAMASMAGVDVGARIAGEQFFLSVMSTLEESGKGRIFFFGSTERVLDSIRDQFEARFPSLELCGEIAPPLWPWSEGKDREMVEQINGTHPDVLWVGLGAPKQEKWVYRNRHSLNVSLIGSIGAVFDYFAGTNPPPPAWVRRMGLETPYRFTQEPRRLWRRVFVSNSQFVIRVLWKHVFRSS